MQRKGCGAVTHMALWGSSFLPMYPHHHESLTPIVLLMSAGIFDDFRKLLRISDTWIEMKDQVSCLENEIPTSLLFTQWAFLIPFICQLLHLPPSSFSGLQGRGQSLGYAARYVGVPLLHLLP